MEFLFYIEGLNREEWVNAQSYNMARNNLWNSLTSDEQDAVVQIECIDQKSE